MVCKSNTGHDDVYTQTEGAQRSVGENTSGSVGVCLQNIPYIVQKCLSPWIDSRNVATECAMSQMQHAPNVMYTAMHALYMQGMHA